MADIRKSLLPKSPSAPPAPPSPASKRMKPPGMDPPGIPDVAPPTTRPPSYVMACDNTATASVGSCDFLPDEIPTSMVVGKKTSAESSISELDIDPVHDPAASAASDETTVAVLPFSLADTALEPEANGADACKQVSACATPTSKNPQLKGTRTMKKKKERQEAMEVPKWTIAWILSKTENFVAFLIVLNAVSLGAEVHNTISSCTPTLLAEIDGLCLTDGLFRPIDVFFTVIFTMELTAKIWVQRSRFLKRSNIDFRWNVFDSVIVGLSLLDELISLIESVSTAGSQSGLPLKQIKMLRLLRVIRVLRILRTIRFVRDLRVMIVGIMNSIKSIVWALTILISVQYVLAIIILSFLKMSLESHAGDKSVAVDIRDGNNDEGPFDRYYFLDVNRGYTRINDIIWNLFLGISGGADWGDYIYPITQMSPEYEWIFRCLFIVYISFTLFCVLNILTGVFVDNANKLVAKDEDNMLMNEMEERDLFNQSIEKTFNEMDKNGNGTIGDDEFADICSDEKIQVLLKKIGVDVTPETAQGFFQMLDFDQDGVLSLDEFKQGIGRLSGTAKSFDMALVLVNVKKSMQLLEEMTREVRKGVHLDPDPLATPLASP